MALFESVFDILYLSLVIALAIQLTLQTDKRAKMFGIMGIVLGLGDTFHLLPRIISHWSTLGFAGNAALLSWGKAVTSVGMTLFYLLYYRFLKMQMANKNKYKDYLIYGLTIIRIVLIAMPQNQWGTLPGSYTFAILRNIPFAIMGLLLIVWSHQNRQADGIKHMALLISLSFIFYIPVVLWVDVVPLLGALMIPKTIAYFLIVYFGYRRFMPEFSIRRLAEQAFVYLIFGLAAGVFFREFSKAYDFSATTVLSKIHVHLLVLGVVGSLILYGLMIVLQPKNPNLINKLKLPLTIWNAGLTLMIVMMLLKGIIEVLGSNYFNTPVAAVAGIAGIGHVLLAIGLVMTSKLFVSTRY